MVNVTTNPSKPQKPAKPRPDFPLFPHATKRWAKKVRGKLEYFGPWEDPEAAEAEWERCKASLLSGLGKPRKISDALAIADAFDEFLIEKKKKVTNGAIKQRTWDEYKAVIDVMLKTWGKEFPIEDLTPRHFGKLRDVLGEGKRPKTLHNLITRCNVVIKFYNDNREHEQREVRTGSYFDKPTIEHINRDRDSQDHGGNLMLESHQLREVLAEARPQIKAMILLGINVGMGNEDCARLQFKHIDLKKGWLDFPRPKNAAKRRAKLWPETIKALKKVIEDRPKPKDPSFDKFVLLTRNGNTWFKPNRANPISREFKTLLVATDNYVKGVGFYSLRRAFETIACETLDQPAVDLSMGHKSPGMAALYRQRLGDVRLEAVAKHVRKWLFGKRVAK